MKPEAQDVSVWWKALGANEENCYFFQLSSDSVSQVKD